MRSWQWAFYAISFLGVVVMKQSDARIELPVLAMGIGAAALAGFAYNCVRKLKDYDEPIVVIFYFPLVTLPLITPWTVTHWVAPAGWEEWVLLLVIGLLTQFAQFFMTKSYQAERAGKVANIGYMGTVYALIFGYIFFGEIFGWQSIVGMALVFVGIMANIIFTQRKRA